MPVTKVQSNWHAGSLAFREDGGARLILPNVVYQVRLRATIAEVNAGLDLVAAPPAGFKLRMVDAILIAEGGAAAGATSVRVSGTSGSSAVHLVTAAVAGLTQNTVARIGATNIGALAAGASFEAMDEATGLTLNANGTLTTATHIHALVSYVIDEA